jgi:glycine/D-amino acid oxidase-like deaminating enzyme
MDDSSGYRRLSLWLDQCDDLTPRASLPGDRDYDVAIVGGGYTGLWTAYYLKRADPSIRVAVLEAEICGFGASGRNGGWCSALFAAPKSKVAAAYGRDAAIAMQKAMFSTIDEVGDVAKREGIECGFVKGGTFTLVTAPAQLERVRDEIASEREWTFGEDDYRWLDRDQLEAEIRVAGALGAAFTPHCARIDPARLVRGLASVVESAGVDIYERTRVESFADGKVETSRGLVKAEVVVRATEGYTPRLPNLRRRVIPLYSLMIATEPLPSDFWDQVGWGGRQTITDGRHLLIYAQRTTDDRIALGGRGAPYHFGSRVEPEFDREPKVFAELGGVLTSLFPGAERAHITHAWGGPLAAPRDWFSSVGYDSEARIAWAGGYVGDGVSTSNLAGRTLADLIAGRNSEVTSLPWVGHKWREWEPEPLRWLGVNAALWTMGSADRVEARTGKPARRARLIDRLLGR